MIQSVVLEILRLLSKQNERHALIENALPHLPGPKKFYSVEKVISFPPNEPSVPEIETASSILKIASIGTQAFQTEQCQTKQSLHYNLDEMKAQKISTTTQI
jgi:hypothetical protein